MCSCFIEFINKSFFATSLINSIIQDRSRNVGFYLSYDPKNYFEIVFLRGNAYILPFMRDVITAINI